MDRKLYGKTKIKVDGREIAVFAGSTLDPGGTKRTTQNGSTQVLGFTEEVMNSKIECDAKFGVGDSIANLDFANVTVQFVTDTGQTYVIPSAWRTDPPGLSEGGKAKIVIEGDPAEEMV